MINRKVRRAGIVLGLVAAVLNLSGCHPEHFKMRPNNQGISALTYDALKTGYQTEGGVRAGAASRPGPTIVVVGGQAPQYSEILPRARSILINLATGERTEYDENLEREDWMNDAKKFPKGYHLTVIKPGYPNPSRYTWHPK